VQIPDDVGQRPSAVGGDLSRRALKALVAEEYKQGRLTKPDLRRLLGFETSDQIDSFLKAHDVWIDCTMEDLERERAPRNRYPPKAHDSAAPPSLLSNRIHAEKRSPPRALTDWPLNGHMIF